MTIRAIFRIAAECLAAVAFIVLASQVPSAATGGMTPVPEAAKSTLKVVNQCNFKVWLQQENIDGAPELVKVGKGKSYTYKIVPQGDPSTMVWAKKGCDKNGNNCKIGQTRDPCPASGCMPDFNSRVEATWGCTGPGCDNSVTYYDTSQVDGYTFPFLLRAKGSVDNDACVNVNCNRFSNSACPRKEDLSSNGKYPKYNKVDLRARDPQSGKVLGCFSPCEKMTAGKSAGGYGFAADDPQAILYCCPSFANNPQKTEKVKQRCLAGPVPDSDYVSFVHKACRKRAYGWAYDDVNGLHVCGGTTRLVMKVCPDN
ncbi:hypothetical protein [Microbaculum marinum]|uniref:Thaumatin pathogenesis-related protein n=1 Tax=Microbaculum marinum TaxID=1764581 RepID=A0AAW9RX19_9HYPH